LALVVSAFLLVRCAWTQAGAAAPQSVGLTPPASPVAQAVAPASAASVALPASANTALQLPAFDVVSIKPYGPSDLRIGIHTKPDGVAISGGIPMHMILREAFGVTNDRLLGEPAWVTTSRYDVDAKVAPEDAPKFRQLTLEQQWAMLLPVLQERCALKFHHETRELTVYTLVIAKGGLKMQLSSSAGNATGPAVDRKPASAGMSVGDSGLTMTGHGVSLASIAHMVAMQLGSTVVDKTGLSESYDYTLSFVPDDSMKAGIMLPGSSGGGTPPPEPEGPPIFTALQEQLGLRLVARKEPVDVIVIDHMDQPTAN